MIGKSNQGKNISNKQKRKYLNALSKLINYQILRNQNSQTKSQRL